MSVTKRTRKPVDQLVIEDLRKYPVWEYAIDDEGADTEQDETWVQPVTNKAVPRGGYSQIVAANFTAANGSVFCGFMIVTTAGSKVEITPGAVIGDFGYKVLPHQSHRQALADKHTWVIKNRDALLKSIQASERDVFPMRFELRVPIQGEKHLRTGNVE